MAQKLMWNAANYPETVECQLCFLLCLVFLLQKKQTTNIKPKMALMNSNIFVVECRGYFVGVVRLFGF